MRHVSHTNIWTLTEGKNINQMQILISDILLISDFDKFLSVVSLKFLSANSSGKCACSIRKGNSYGNSAVFHKSQACSIIIPWFLWDLWDKYLL